MKDHILNGHRLRCYHKPSRDISTHPDAWTVLYMDKECAEDPGFFLGIRYIERNQAAGMAMCCPGVHLGRRIPFDLLPEPCRRAVLADCPRNGFHEVAWCYSTSPAASALGFPAGCWAVFFVPSVNRDGQPTIAVSGHTTRRGADSACARLNA